MKIDQELRDAKGMKADDLEPEMEELVDAEIETLEAEKEILEEELRLMLLPKDPNDEKNVIVEIRG